VMRHPSADDPMKSYRNGSWGNHTQGTMQYSQKRGKHDQPGQ